MKFSNIILATFAAMVSQGQIVAAESGPIPYAFYQDHVGEGGSTRPLRLKARRAATAELASSDTSTGHQLSKRVDYVTLGFSIASFCMNGASVAAGIWWARKTPSQQDQFCLECATRVKHNKAMAKAVNIPYDPKEEASQGEVSKVKNFLAAAKNSKQPAKDAAEIAEQFAK